MKGDYMKKEILVVALALVLCFGMTGCTNGDIEPESSRLANKYIDLVEYDGSANGKTIYHLSGSNNLIKEEAYNNNDVQEL